MTRDDDFGFAQDVAYAARDVALEPALWVPAATLSVATDLLMYALEWPFRGGPMPPERTITTMAIVILAKAWFGLALCRIALALLRRRPAGFLANWVPVTSAIRIGIVNVVLFAPMVLGAILLVIPGLYLLALWSQVVMLQLDGRARWFEAANHSATLTDGYKLTIVAIWAVPLAASALIGWLASRIGLDTPGVAGFLFASVGRVAASLAGVALAGATYYELSRRAPWHPEDEVPPRDARNN